MITAFQDVISCSLEDICLRFGGPFFRYCGNVTRRRIPEYRNIYRHASEPKISHAKTFCLYKYQDMSILNLLIIVLNIS
jgi:hypothetical protein